MIVGRDDETESLTLPPTRSKLKPKFKPKVPPPEEMEVDRNQLKRKLGEDVVGTEDGPARKKIKPNKTPLTSPSKAQRLEEEGLVILEDEVTIVLDD